ncbi:MAG: hypothetical protein KDF65_15130 [Anaerolineae bacterium]|nr:hypothetical protein [Anaerolineae bacterium]
MSIFSKPAPRNEPEQPVSPVVFIPRLLAGIITPLDLPPEDQTFIEQELTWLFHAVNHFLAVQQLVQQQFKSEREAIRQRLNAEEQALIRRVGPAGAFVNKAAKIEGELAPLKPQIWQAAIANSGPVAVDFPPNVERSPSANNRLLANLSDFFLEDWAGTIRANLQLMTTHLTALDLLLTQERRLGAEGKRNIALQNEIKSRRVANLALCQEIATGLNQIYGVLATSPGQLLAWLKEN